MINFTKKSSGNWNQEETGKRKLEPMSFLLLVNYVLKSCYLTKISLHVPVLKGDKINQNVQNWQNVLFLVEHDLIFEKKKSKRFFLG